jgi:prevent-host-death family protein
MKYSQDIKPISYLKTNASKVVKDVSSNGKTMIITHNGEAKVVLQDIHVYEQLQDSLALLKVLAQSSRSVEKGDHKPIDKAFKDLGERVQDENNK